MAAFKEKRTVLTDPYVTAGNRLYVIGTQDGLFPDSGGHIPGEMGGVWAHPIKLVDGFFVGVTTDSDTTWPISTMFRTYPFFTEHHYEQPDYTLIRRQFVPDDAPLLVVTLEYTNHTKVRTQAELKFVVKSDLRPGWLGTEEDGVDRVRQQGTHLVFEDSKNPWTVCLTSDSSVQSIQLDDAGSPYQTQGNGVAGTLVLPLDCAPGETVTTRIFIAGSMDGVGVCEQDLVQGIAGYEQSLAQKRQRYDEIDRTSSITVPNPVITDAIRWVKINTDWLVRHVPSVGNGLGAGFPEYPWWFGCDNGYALLGVLAAGGFDLAKDTLRLLAQVSERENGNGRIIHEVSSTGVVFNPGNTQETPQFCKTVWEVFSWTGDEQFLRELYPMVERAMAWTLSMAPDGDDLALGYGIMEVENLNARLIDTAVATQQGLEALANMVDVLGDATKAGELRRRSEALRDTILTRFWVEDEGLYADVLADVGPMNNHLQTWAEEEAGRGHHEAAEKYRNLVNPSNTKELLPYVLKNWVISTPMEAGIAPRSQAARALGRMRTAEFMGPNGLYLNGIERNRMMTISTSVQAVAECRYGFVDEAVNWIELMALTQDIRMPGSICEMSPDYGCFVQAWTIYGMLYPIVAQMFGVQPHAHRRACTLDVRMPSDWNDATLDQLRIGDNVISLTYERTSAGEMVTIQSALTWRVHFTRDVEIINVTTDMTDNRSLDIASGQTVRIRLK